MAKLKVQWSSHLSDEPEGILVGCSQNQECLLPWWWMNFRLHNNHPVTFVNFGDLSDPAIKWCKLRGHVINIEIDTFVTVKEEIDLELAKRWEGTNQYVWLFRPSWFLKPFALLKSPYRKTIWFDLDCQVRAPIQALFSDYLKNVDLAMVPEPEQEQQRNRELKILLPDEVMYNGGVIVYNHGCPIIQEWAKLALTQNHLFMGDQQLLTRILYERKEEIESLPRSYNWPVAYGINREATVIHWWGAYKASILKQIDYLQEQFLINLSFF